MSLHGRHRLLCVDSDADSFEMLSTLLKYSMIDSESASNAAQALSMSQVEPFDVYLLEAWLPDVDGFELCRQLRTSDPDTPIVFFSAAAYDADKRKAFQAGASEYVSKPDIDALLQSLSKHIPNVEMMV
ncbi:MAG TPA: response regulator [Pyrinomonadaceae bacterium]|jgi:CheY-like chemotaxis protein|nr:response regulator [Pyrinomonadaceae bacterium]